MTQIVSRYVIEQNWHLKDEYLDYRQPREKHYFFGRRGVVAYSDLSVREFNSLASATRMLNKVLKKTECERLAHLYNIETKIKENKYFLEEN